MDRINISESDRTAPSTVSLPTEVVYVPGFTCDPTNVSTGVYVADSVAKFNSLVGNTAANFSGTDGKYDNTGVNFSQDLSYYYAKNLINQGLTVAYDVISATPNVTTLYTAMSAENSSFDKLGDLGEYNVKYITSGAYPVVFNNSSTIDTSIASKMVGAAKTRGDAVAIVDHAYNFNMKNEYNQFKGSSISDGEFGTIFTGSGNYSVRYGGTNGEINLPASYGYLSALAKSIKTNESYLAVAGVTRGIVPNLVKLDVDTTNSQADKYQSEGDELSVNAITNINPYGLTIWGNRTLRKGKPSATSFLSIRNMLSGIKKSLRSIALSMLFEQNSDVLWLRFKSRAGAMLDRYVAGNGILNYSLVKNSVDRNGNEVDRYKMNIDVIIQPVYPVEAVSIQVVVTNDEVAVA